MFFSSLSIEEKKLRKYLENFDWSRKILSQIKKSLYPENFIPYTSKNLFPLQKSICFNSFEIKILWNYHRKSQRWSREKFVPILLKRIKFSATFTFFQTFSTFLSSAFSFLWISHKQFFSAQICLVAYGLRRFCWD